MQIIAKTLAFEDFTQLLAESDSLANPAEIHGILCGLICSGQKLDGNFWFHTILKLFESRAHITSQNRGMVLDLYDTTCRQLSGLENSFQLLLPGDSHSLSRRAEALSHWCQGFLFGLRVTDFKLEKNSSDENRDALNCISEIAQLDFGKIEVREIDNVAYRGVVEYIRSAVTTLYEESAKIPDGQVRH